MKKRFILDIWNLISLYLFAENWKILGEKKKYILYTDIFDYQRIFESQNRVKNFEIQLVSALYKEIEFYIVESRSNLKYLFLFLVSFLSRFLEKEGKRKKFFGISDFLQRSSETAASLVFGDYLFGFHFSSIFFSPSSSLGRHRRVITDPGNSC